MKTIIVLILSLISTNVYGDIVVENFNSNPGNRWQFLTDQVMGGKSYGKLEFFTEENKLLHLTMALESKLYYLWALYYSI